MSLLKRSSARPLSHSLIKGQKCSLQVRAAGLAVAVTDGDTTKTEYLGITLAVSLHQANNHVTRDRLQIAQWSKRPRQHPATPT